MFTTRSNDDAEEGDEPLTWISDEGSFTWNSIISLSSERIRSKTGKTIGPIRVILVADPEVDAVIPAAAAAVHEDDVR